MSSSLNKLVNNLPKDDLIHTSKAFKSKRLDLMSQKGAYPYDFMDSSEKFNQTELPTKDQFYSILNDQHITNDEYDHAKKVWKTFNIKKTGEYHDLYLASDVLLLTDVFENFRKTCMQYYKLDQCHYFRSPGLSWDATLKMTNIGKFETRNNISVNVYAVEGRDIYIHRKGQRMGREINLLMISEDGINHYTAIKSLSRLLKSSNTKHKCKQHFCMNCLQRFRQESSRDQHQVYCENNKSVRVEMPKQGSTVEFKDGQNQFRVPFIMYADFESILEPMDPVEPGSPNPSQLYTNEVNQHMPTGWCVYSKFAYGDVDDPLRTYRGKDCIEKFCNYIKGEACRLYHMFPELHMGPLTKKQWNKYKKATKCHICYKPFTQTNLKVRDHCHYIGLYRGPAHSLCN